MTTKKEVHVPMKSKDEIQGLGFALGMICLGLGLFDFIAVNYIFIFQLERRGTHPVRNLIFLNVMSLIAIFFGRWLIKKFSKRSY